VLGLRVDWQETLRTLIEQCQPDQTFVLKMRQAKPIEHWQTTNITLLGDAIHVMPPNGSGANTALGDASLLSRSLIAVARQGMPLHQALHDYEIEMLRYGFDAVRTFRQGGGLGSPFTPTR
jgi:2-polyprenyl-6-methoxyphenol hydroxylase-like FAD-dependent oxidoreductase